MPGWSDLGKSEVKEKPLERIPQACGGGRAVAGPASALETWSLSARSTAWKHESQGLTHSAQEVWGREILFSVVSSDYINS